MAELCCQLGRRCPEIVRNFYGMSPEDISSLMKITMTEDGKISEPMEFSKDDISTIELYIGQPSLVKDKSFYRGTSTSKPAGLSNGTRKVIRKDSIRYFWFAALVVSPPQIAASIWRSGHPPPPKNPRDPLLVSWLLNRQLFYTLIQIRNGFMLFQLLCSKSERCVTWYCSLELTFVLEMEFIMQSSD